MSHKYCVVENTSFGVILIENLLIGSSRHVYIYTCNAKITQKQMMNTFKYLLSALACTEFVFVSVFIFVFVFFFVFASNQYLVTQMQITNTFNHLLIVLACIDNIFLLLTILDYSSARGYLTSDDYSFASYVMQNSNTKYRSR